MVGPLKPKSLPAGYQSSGATRRTAVGLILGAPLLGACAGMNSFSNPFSSQPGPSGPVQEPLVAGTGQVKVGLILPLSATGNAGVAAQSMKNAAEMALAEFQNPNIQLLIKDDAGTPQGAGQERSRRSMKAPRSCWVRCLRCRFRQPRNWRARGAYP